jgi:hypothetical protein
MGIVARLHLLQLVLMVALMVIDMEHQLMLQQIVEAVAAVVVGQHMPEVTAVLVL